MSYKGMLHVKKLVTATATGLLLTVTACSSQGGAQNAPGAAGGSGGSASGGPSFTIAMVTHEAPGSTFWDRIRAGAEQAAEQHGIELKYSSDPDSGKQATLIPGVPLTAIVEHDLYPTPPDVPLPIATRTNRYYRDCGLRTR